MGTRCRFLVSLSAALAMVPAVSYAEPHRVRARPYFERNQGQAPAPVQFVVRAPALVGSLTADGLVMHAPQGPPTRLRFVAASLALPIAEQPLATRAHYFVGAPSGWRHDIPTFGRIRYRDIRPGVDLVVYGSDRESHAIEYDLIVAPGTDPRHIGVILEGASVPRLRADGSLAWTIGTRELIQSAPIAYQEDGGTRRRVEAGYRVLKSGEVRVEVGRYDRKKALVIDPTLTFSTYVRGGTSSETLNDLAIDAAGNIYVAGQTASTDLATAGAFQTGRREGDESYVTKLDATGTTVVWATYIGGNSHDIISALALDSARNVYVVGHTISTDFPTTPGAFDRRCGEDGACGPVGGDIGGRRRDGFVLKLNSSGSGIVYGTYLGGAPDDWLQDIGVDAAGRAHVAGEGSGNYPVTPGAYIGSGPGGLDAVHTTLNASGTAVVYSTFLGGSGPDRTANIAVRNDGSRVVAFSTASTDVPTVAPVQPARAGDQTDAFVVSFGATSAVQFATYFGGSSFEFPEAVAIGADRSIYVTATTYSSDIPGQRDFGPVSPGDVLVFKLSDDGQRVGYVSRIGGSMFDTPRDVVVDRFGRALVTGTTSSSDFYTTANDGDPILMVLAATGQPTYSTLFGGARFDSGTAMAIAPDEQVLIGGSTSSTSFPVRNGLGPPPGMRPSEDIEGFLTKFAVEPPSPGGGGATGEVVLYASEADLHGNWARVSDAGAAGGFAAHHPNAGAPRVTAPLASPTHYFEMTFVAEAGIDHHLWIRGRADGNVWPNDSVYVQFSDSVDTAGAPRWRLGTTSGTTVQIERCVNCGLRGWGWNDNDGSLSNDPNAAGGHVRFETSGRHTIRVQTREDGLRIDQIVISASRYLSTSPGAGTNDATILDPSDGSGGGGGPACLPREVVLHAIDGTVHGAWQKTADAAAASGIKAYHPNAGAPRVGTPLAAPVNYVELTFFAEANVAYRFWMRGRADANNWNNDAAYIQFSDSVTAGGAPTWRIGTTSAGTFTLENCANCTISGWGWNDTHYGGFDVAPPVRFAATGTHTIRIQTREDGLAFDQIVLSAERYFQEAPGNVRDDTTILDKCASPPETTTESR
jgi:hypothetical protein